MKKYLLAPYINTILWSITIPLKNNNLIMCDTGGGYSGKLTIIDINTLNYHQVGGVSEYNIINDLGK